MIRKYAQCMSHDFISLVESILWQVKILRHWHHHNNYKLCVASSGLLTHWMASFSGCVLCVYGTMQMSHLFWLPQNFNINIEGQMEEKSLGVILMGDGGSCWNQRKNLDRIFSRLRAVAAKWCTFDFVTFSRVNATQTSGHWKKLGQKSVDSVRYKCS